MQEGVTQAFLDQGLMGAIAVALAGVVAYLFMALRAETKEHRQTIEKILPVMAEVTATVSRNTEVITELTRELRFGGKE